MTDPFNYVQGVNFSYSKTDHTIWEATLRETRLLQQKQSNLLIFRAY